MTDEIEAGADIIDIRDVIARVEELREEREALDEAVTDAQEALDETPRDAEDTTTLDETTEALEDARSERESWNNSDEATELAQLESLLDDLCGYGGDEQWEGNWYPLSLILDSHFTDAMRELVQDIGDLPRDIPGYLVIDWEATANNLRADYSSVDFDGHTYWYR